MSNTTTLFWVLQFTDEESAEQSSKIQKVDIRHYNNKIDHQNLLLMTFFFVFADSQVFQIHLRMSFISISGTKL